MLREYGIDTIEIHEDAINENDIVLLHDDLLYRRNHESSLRSGKEIPSEKVYANFIIELVNEISRQKHFIQTLK